MLYSKGCVPPMKTTKAVMGAIGLAAMVACLTCFVTGLVGAHVSTEGAPPFAFYAGWVERPSGMTPGKLVVVWNGVYPDTASGWARLQLPSGVHLVSGDTLATGRPHGEGFRWEVSVRCDDAEPRYIRGVMWVDDHSQRVDEAEFDLKCSNTPDSMKADYSVARREECIVGGQRFRYGGMFRVPIDAPEYLVEKDIEDNGAHPDVESTAELTDQRISSAVDTVTCVVFVRPNGTVRDVRTLGGAAMDTQVLAAVQDGVAARWRFRPARVKNISVDDWLLIRVPLRRP